MEREQVEYRDRVLRIAELTVTSDLVEEILAVNCVIDGPAVLVLIDNTRFDRCCFDLMGGEPDAMFIEVPEGKTAVGVVGLRAAAFESCRFQRVAFIGTAAMLATIREGIS